MKKLMTILMAMALTFTFSIIKAEEEGDGPQARKKGAKQADVKSSKQKEKRDTTKAKVGEKGGKAASQKAKTSGK